MSAHTVAEVLALAAEILSERDWCQGSSAQDERGRPIASPAVELEHALEQAPSICLETALYLAADYNNPLQAQASTALRLHLGINVPSFVWNDEQGRSKEEVVLTLKEAARQAREAGL